ncbi:MAG: hypothetical protein K2M19_08225 [Muribaculaceae bacterium]|nr:hypothetical protein [Muribaculaceae bacterium]
MKYILSALFLLLSSVGYAAADTRDEIEHLMEVTDSLHGAGRTDSAALVGARAIELSHELGDPTLIIGTHANQGVYLRSLGKVNEALASYDAALAIATSEQFRDNPDAEAIEQIASLYINLAVLDLDMQHKDDAVKHAELSGEWIARGDDPALKSMIYGAAGSVLTGCGELEKALGFQKLAYDNAMQTDNADAAFRAAAYTMLIADRLGDKAEADSQRERCAALMPRIESMMTLLAYYQIECSICLKNGDNAGAVQWFDKILALDGIDNLPFVKFDCYNNLHMAQAAIGDYRDAYNTLLKGNELRDSLWEQEKSETLRELTVKYETKETQLALAQSEARRARTLMWLFAAVGLLLAAIVVFIVYAGRQRRRRMQREIEFANLRADIGRQLTQQYVEGLENERQRMSRELHDGVCNDLLAIRRNVSNGGSAENAVSLLDACRESVRRISHELMPPEFAYATLDEVVKFLVAKQAEANAGTISFKYESAAADADWHDVPDDIALEVYRIIQEAVGNAVRHSGATEIMVRMSLDGNTLSAEIKDNGTYKSGSRKGLGIDSIRRRAASINGHVALETSPGGGSSVSLTVKTA